MPDETLPEKSPKPGFTLSRALEAPAEYTLFTAAGLLAEPFPPEEMILEPWLPLRGLAMVYGPRGIGKTHLSMALAVAVATGTPFLRWQAPKARPVLVVDGEMPGNDLQRRLAGALGGAPPPDTLRFLSLDVQRGQRLDISDVECHGRLQRAIGDAELVIVDSITTLARQGRENEAESWLPVQQWALGLRSAGRSVLFIHHAGKGGQQRGTSRREDVLNSVLALRKPEGWQPRDGARFEVHYEKARGFLGGDADAFEARLREGAWTVGGVAEAEPVDSPDAEAVRAMTAEGRTVRDISEALGMSKSKVHNLRKAREGGAAP